MNNIKNPASVTTATLPTQTLLEVAAANGSFAKFGQAIEKSGLAAHLASDGPFTIFAPTDAAFDQLPAGRFDALLEPANKDELASILNYHILAGRRSLADVGKWKSARTVHGQSAPILTTGQDVRIDGAQVTLADLASKNGTIHGIDKVMIPIAASTTVRPVEAVAPA